MKNIETTNIEKKRIFNKKDVKDYFKNKLDSYYEIQITNIEKRKIDNLEYNSNLNETLMDKVYYKAVDLNTINTMMDNKIEKLKLEYQTKLESIEYKKRNFIIDQLNYESHIKSIDLKYNNKINILENKFKSRTTKYNLKFESYKNKIKTQSLELLKENKVQEDNYNHKIDKKIEELKNKHKKLQIKNKSFLDNSDSYYESFIESANVKYNNYQSELNTKLVSNLIGPDIYKKELNKYELKLRSTLNKSLKTSSILNTPLNFKKAKLDTKITKFGDYSKFKQFDKKFLGILNGNKLIIAIIIFSLIVGFINPAFFAPSNWFNNIMGNNVYFGLLAIGMTFVILIGGIDLSVGSGLALSGSIMLLLFKSGLPIYVAILIGIIVSVAISLIMGVIISYGKFQAFIVTLVGLLVLSGINKVILDGSPVSVSNDFINLLGSSINGIFPVVLFIFIAVLLLAYFALRWTKYGRKIYATGSNVEAARVSGINVKWIITSTFLISGITVALASLVYIAQIKSVSPTTGSGFELDAIAAVVLGGTSLAGGKGSVVKTMVGWLVISMLGNIFVFLGLDSNIQLIAKGAIILVAIFLDKNFSLYSKLINTFKKASYKLKTI